MPERRRSRDERGGEGCGRGYGVNDLPCEQRGRREEHEGGSRSWKQTAMREPSRQHERHERRQCEPR